MNGHWSDIKWNHAERPVVAHFNTAGHSINDLSIRVIEQLWRDDTGRLYSMCTSCMVIIEIVQKGNKTRFGIFELTVVCIV